MLSFPIESLLILLKRPKHLVLCISTDVMGLLQLKTCRCGGGDDKCTNPAGHASLILRREGKEENKYSISQQTDPLAGCCQKKLWRKESMCFKIFQQDSDDRHAWDI